MSVNRTTAQGTELTKNAGMAEHSLDGRKNGGKSPSVKVCLRSADHLGIRIQKLNLRKFNRGNKRPTNRLYTETVEKRSHESIEQNRTVCVFLTELIR